MSTYILVDTANTFFRARHVIRGDLDAKIGMALHITLNSVKKSWNDFNADHVVFCLEGRSWRKDYYEPYKRNRQIARDALTESQVEETTVEERCPKGWKKMNGECVKVVNTIINHPKIYIHLYVTSSKILFTSSFNKIILSIYLKVNLTI